MSVTTEKIVDKIEIIGEFAYIQVREATRVLDDGDEVTRTYYRYVLVPGDDLSNEDPKVVAICNAIWDDELLVRYQDYLKSLDDAL